MSNEEIIDDVVRTYFKGGDWREHIKEVGRERKKEKKMKENWYALCVAILNPKQLTIEESFFKYATGKVQQKRRYTKEEIEDMYKLKQLGVPLKEISQIYGRDKTNVCHVLKKFEREIKNN